MVEWYVIISEKDRNRDVIPSTKSIRSGDAVHILTPLQHSSRFHQLSKVVVAYRVGIFDA